MLDNSICEKARLSRDARFDGKFYTAVLTTGIFCRPICPARPPKSENVTYYQSAEQAQQAGFRPCKRCIPEFAPAYINSQKLKNIINNYDISQDSITLISKRFGMSERQLHRLFKSEYGLSPKQFFQQQRLLLARKLLKNSNLSMADIAFAAGFNSLRRFNESIKNAYHCTPSALKSNSSPNNYVEVELAYRPPLDWPLMLKFFKERQIHGLESVTDDQYQRTVNIDHCQGWLSIRHHPTRDALILNLQLNDYKYLNNILLRVRRMFDLDADIKMIHQQLSKHDKLASVIKKFPGLTLPGSWDLFEFSIRAILGQQVSVKAATTLAKRIVHTYGTETQALTNNLTFYFPTTTQLSQASFEDLGLTQSRIATLQRWINFYQQHQDTITISASVDELTTLIEHIKGIGPWTINYLAMRGLSYPDAFPSADLGIIKALTKNNKKPTNKEVLTLAKQWQPWRAYAAIYLWHSLH